MHVSTYTCANEYNVYNAYILVSIIDDKSFVPKGVAKGKQLSTCFEHEAKFPKYTFTDK